MSRILELKEEGMTFRMRCLELTFRDETLGWWHGTPCELVMVCRKRLLELRKQNRGQRGDGIT